MRQYFTSFIFLFFTLLCPSAFSAAATNDISDFQFPVAETSNILGTALKRGGFSLVEESSYEGKAVFLVEKQNRQVRLTVFSNSPLASKVELVGEKYDVDQIAALIRKVKDKGDATDYGLFDSPFFRQIRYATVCIQGASRTGAEFLFSGVVINRDGLILSTGHDLEDVKVLKVTFADGSQYEGRLVRRDISKDLSLIKTRRTTDISYMFPLNRSRSLGLDETVYMFSCTDFNKGKPYIGKVNRPVAKVDNQLLLQMQLEVQKGTSGSLVTDSKGNFAGILKGRFRGTTTRAFVIPPDTVKNFMGQGI